MGVCFGKKGTATAKGKQAKTEVSLRPLSVDHLAIRKLLTHVPKKVVVVAGAGMSVSAGIPDFRSPGTGLYDNLQKYDLPYPQAVFELKYFRSHPEPFTLLAKDLWPSNFQPTISHVFVRLLEKKGLLLRHFTQNIDGLDRAAGISDDLIVEAHGSFGAGACIDCKRRHSSESIRETIFRGEVVRCECGGLVKPNIVFFGEDLPDKFWRCSNQDMAQRDLVVIVIGTSLQVNPFASLGRKGRASRSQRILINMEMPESFEPDEEDLVLLGDCDSKVKELAQVLGWSDELDSLVAYEDHDL